jgi:hypothetical protein
MSMRASIALKILAAEAQESPKADAFAVLHAVAVLAGEIAETLSAGPERSEVSEIQRAAILAEQAARAAEDRQLEFNDLLVWRPVLLGICFCARRTGNGENGDGRRGERGSGGREGVENP